MPYWYYAGKTTTCIDLPDPDDRTKLIPTVIIPRQRFHAPRASIHHLLKTKPPQIKLLKDPPVPKVEKPAPVPAPAKAPTPTPKASAEPPKSVREEAPTDKSGDTDANSTPDVLASPTSSDAPVEEEEVANLKSEEAKSEPEKKSSKSSRKGRRGRGSSSD